MASSVFYNIPIYLFRFKITKSEKIILQVKNIKLKQIISTILKKKIGKIVLELFSFEIISNYYVINK
jgi:hypothetical protein